MNRILNILLGVFVSAAVVYLLIEEYRENPDAGKTVVNFMSIGQRQQKEAYEEVIAEFEKENPDIKVNLQWGSTGRFFGVLLTRMAGGIPPDIVFMSESRMPFFVEKNTLEDLRPYIEKDLPDYEEDFHPLAREAFEYKGGIYTMGITRTPILVLYNKKLFDAAGVPYPRPDWTWDECLDMARKLTRRDPSGRLIQYGFSDALKPELIEKMGPQRGLIRGNPVRANCASPEFVAVVQFATDLVVKYRVAPRTASGESVGGPLFDAGKAAMTINGRWMCPMYDKIEGLAFDVAPMPKWRDGVRRTTMGAVGCAMSRECRNKPAAWRFLKYVTSKKSLALLTRLGDTVPARKSVLYSSDFLTPDVQPANDQAYIDSLEHSRFETVTEPPIPDYFPQAIEFLALGKGNVETKMKEVQDLTDRFLVEKKAVILR